MITRRKARQDAAARTSPSSSTSLTSEDKPNDETSANVVHSVQPKQGNFEAFLPNFVIVDKRREAEEEQDKSLWKLPPHLAGNDYFASTTNDKVLLRISVSSPSGNDGQNGDDCKGFSLSQSICSYGYFALAPNRWVPSQGKDDDDGYLVRPLRFGKNHQHAVLVAIGQDQEKDEVLVAVDLSTIDNISQKEEGAHQQAVWKDDNAQELVRQVSRMLRLDMDLAAFHHLHPEAKRRGFGRLYRSPTLFEDLVKTITNCNMKWSGTVDMNAKLSSAVVGLDGAFPTPHEIYHQTDPSFLKQNCRLGYRSEWIWQLSKDFAEDKISFSTNESRDETRANLLRIKGFGEFASNNVLQLLGHFDSFPYDTETVRLFREEYKVVGKTKQDLFEKAKVHYQAYEPYQFIAYWFDLWKNYEKRAGLPSPQWIIEQCASQQPALEENEETGAKVPIQDANKLFQSSPKKKRSKKRQISETNTSS